MGPRRLHELTQYRVLCVSGAAHHCSLGCRQGGLASMLCEQHCSRHMAPGHQLAANTSCSSPASAQLASRMISLSVLEPSEASPKLPDLMVAFPAPLAAVTLAPEAAAAVLPGWLMHCVVSFSSATQASRDKSWLSLRSESASRSCKANSLLQVLSVCVMLRTALAVYISVGRIAPLSRRRGATAATKAHWQGPHAAGLAANVLSVSVAQEVTGTCLRQASWTSRNKHKQRCMNDVDLNLQLCWPKTVEGAVRSRQNLGALCEISWSLMQCGCFQQPPLITHITPVVQLCGTAALCTTGMLLMAVAWKFKLHCRLVHAPSPACTHCMLG